MASAGPKLMNIDVGGTVYRTSLQTLTRIPDCMLAIMVDQKWKLDGTDETETLFIDRDGVPFRYILNYLRDDARTVLPDDQFTLRQLAYESVYYILPGLQEMCVEKLKALEEPPADPRLSTLSTLLQGDPNNLSILVNAQRDKLELLLKHAEVGQGKVDMEQVLRDAQQQQQP